MGLAARVVTRSGRARPVCDSGRGPGPESPGQSPRGAVRGVPSASGSRGSGSRSHQDPLRAWPGAPRSGLRGAWGTGRGGRGAGGCRALRGAGEVCGGARSATSPARRAGTRAGKTLSPWNRAEIGGRPAGRRPSAVCFFSLPAAAAGDEEEDGGAEAERPRPPGVTVAPSGFPAPPSPQGPGHACAVRGGRPDLAS